MIRLIGAQTQQSQQKQFPIKNASIRDRLILSMVFRAAVSALFERNGSKRRHILFDVVVEYCCEVEYVVAVDVDLFVVDVVVVIVFVVPEFGRSINEFIVLQTCR